MMYLLLLPGFVCFLWVVQKVADYPDWWAWKAAGKALIVAFAVLFVAVVLFIAVALFSSPKTVATNNLNGEVAAKVVDEEEEWIKNQLKNGNWYCRENDPPSSGCITKYDGPDYWIPNKRHTWMNVIPKTTP